MTLSHSYQYHPLNNEEPEIRLVLLYPAQEFDSPILCDIVHARFSPDTPYEALSYTWASPEKPKSTPVKERPFRATANLLTALQYLQHPLKQQVLWLDTLRINQEIQHEKTQQIQLRSKISRTENSIFVQNAAIRVTENLSTALRYLRYPLTQRVLWIDALCINQQDQQEKHQQIRLMGKIYQTASRDVLWLDEDHRAIAPALQFLGRAVFPPQTEMRKEVDSLIQKCSQELRVQLMSIFRCSTWRRMWIIQELALAKDVTVSCGPYQIPWATLICAAKAFGTLRSRDEAPPGSQLGVAHVLSIEYIRHLKAKGVLVSQPVQAWLDFRASRATDPKDRIIATLGIVSNNMGIAASMDLPTEEFFCTVARKHIETVQSLKILAYHEKPREKTRHMGMVSIGTPADDSNDSNPSLMTLPSWVPDFSSNDLLHAPRYFWNGEVYKGPWMEQAWTTKCSEAISAASAADLTQLDVYGFVLDSIADVYPSVSDYTAKSVLGAYQRLSHSIHGDEAPKYKPGYQSHLESFWRTICWDMMRVDADGNAVRLSSRPAFELWRTGVKAVVTGATGSKTKSTSHAFGGLKPSAAAANLWEAGVKAVVGAARKTGTSYLLGLESERKAREARSQEAVRLLQDHIQEVSYGFCLANTAAKGSAMVPDAARPGDLVVALYGASGPYILRPVSQSQDSKLVVVGPAYLHGFMDRGQELLEARDRGEYEERMFQLV